MQPKHTSASHSYIDSRILAEAAQWLVQMQEAPLDCIQQAQLEQWCKQSVDHQRAWQRAQRLLTKIGSLPPELAKPALGHTAQKRHNRRHVLSSIASVFLLLPLGWIFLRHQPWYSRLVADHMTQRGEQLEVALDDGSQVTLNTDTALDVQFDPRLRLLHLRKGEIYIHTAIDRVVPSRTFLVQTNEGQLVALGTRFSVRQMDGITHLAVYEGTVQVCPVDAIHTLALTVHAGLQVYFNRQGAQKPPTSASESIVAWRNRLLIADNMPLSQWAAELTRYAGAHIEVSPTVQHLRISGAFPVHDLRHALQMLSDTHHIQVRIEGRKVQIGI